MWDLTDLYPSVDSWNTAHTDLKARVEKLGRYKGTLGGSADAMLNALSAISDTRKDLDRLFVYASLKKDEDVRVAAGQERAGLAQSLSARFGEMTAWITPEILGLGPDKVHAFEAASPELKKHFGFMLENILRAKPHTLSDESEAVLAAASNVLAQPDNIYSQLANGDLPFPSVTLSDGTKIERLDQSAYTQLRQAHNREDRKKVFDTFWGAWSKYEGTFGAMLNTQVLAEEFDAKVR
ncbi:MAG: hypothetical protein WCD42_07525, partial [Rhizomicrobium sp.]